MRTLPGRRSGAQADGIFEGEHKHARFSRLLLPARRLQALHTAIDVVKKSKSSATYPRVESRELTYWETWINGRSRQIEVSRGAAEVMHHILQHTVQCFSVPVSPVHAVLIEVYVWAGGLVTLTSLAHCAEF